MMLEKHISQQCNYTNHECSTGEGEDKEFDFKVLFLKMVGATLHWLAAFYFTH